jgi:hypothetical protein
MPRNPDGVRDHQGDTEQDRRTPKPEALERDAGDSHQATKRARSGDDGPVPAAGVRVPPPIRLPEGGPGSSALSRPLTGFNCRSPPGSTLPTSRECDEAFGAGTVASRHD